MRRPFHATVRVTLLGVVAMGTQAVASVYL